MTQSSQILGSSLAHLLQSPEANTLNLTVLRRMDPAIDQVLACANHVALYDFDRDQHRWVRKDVEGSFFLIHKAVAPFHQIIILNKKNADNFVEDIVPDLGFELTLPYIMYRNKTNEVVGVWFYEEAEARKVAVLLQQITAQFKAGTSIAIGSTVAGQTEQTASADSASTGHYTAQQEQEDAFWDKGTHGAVHDSDTTDLDSSTLEKLFVKMKVPTYFQVPTSPSVPLLQLSATCASSNGTMGPCSLLANSTTENAGASIIDDALGMSEAAPPPQPPRPTLLTPKFLARAKLQPKMHTATSKSAEVRDTQELMESSGTPALQGLQVEEKNDTSLTRFFTMSCPPASIQPCVSDSDAGMTRDRLRKAITVLSRSDAFIDVLAKELSSAGFFD